MRTLSITFALSFSVLTAAGFAAIATSDALAGPAASTRSIDEAPLPAATGAELFAANCSTCHGASGNGDGPAAPGLTPKPRKLTDKAVMSKLSDEQIATTIRKGGVAVGKSPLMPGFGHLGEPNVAALVAHVRSLCGCSFGK
ncbi:MAG: cytochrome c [Kofleriaceae bacterium]|nr:cytochrome c [Kofleriaceae bacterium]